MKTLVIIAIVAAVAYVAANYSPESIKNSHIATSVGTFFSRTVPNYLREKLRIPESPINKRGKVLCELKLSLEGTKQELRKVAPRLVDGKVLPLPSADEIRSHAKKAEEAILEAQQQLKELTSENTEESAFRTAALHVLDRVFPPSPASSTACAVK